MNKKIIVAAVAAAVAAPMAVSADATVYGKARVAVQYADRDSNASPDSSWGMVDQISRLGIKGDEDLGNGLKAIYMMEFGVDVGTGAFGKSTSGPNSTFFSQRNTYVGLAGGWGTFLMGRHDTPLKISSGKLDFFADTAADNDNGSGALNPKSVGLFTSRRVDGAIAYISPSMAGFTVAGALVQTADGVTKDFQDAYSLAAMYSNGPWFASAAYENLNKDNFGGAGFEDHDMYRLGIGILDMANFSAGLIYEDRSDEGGIKNNDSDSWQIQAAYDFGNSRVKAMYGEYDADSGATTSDHDTWAIGLQHNLSKRTDVQVLYRARDNASGISDDNVFALQLDHSF